MNNQPKSRALGLVLATVGFSLAIAGYYFFKAQYLKFDEDRASNENSASSSTETVTTTESNIHEGTTTMNNTSNNSENDLTKALEVGSDGLSKAVAVITTARGKMKFRFYTKDAPNTAARIASLIQTGFYNGLIFHRVVPGFVIQGGDPTGTGAGGTGTKLKAEFNSRKHVPGAVAMARSSDPNSADSQFYITLGTHPHLDNQYTVFGQIIEGQEVANQIQQGDRMSSFELILE